VLSVIIICKNEKNHIRDCLESVSWADEIIVLDSGSTDNTVTICQEYTDKVKITDWPGFGMQKQRALELATQPWVLSLDADERVTEESKLEILDILDNPESVEGYHLPRSSNFCGSFMRYSGWYPDYVLRLFRRDCARFTEDPVHERVICSGNTAHLKSPLLHYTYDSLDEAVEKANLYSSLGAEKLYNEGKKCSISKAVLKGVWAFLRTYLLRQGFRDGKHGFLLAVVNAEATYNKYAKLALKTIK